MSRTVSVASENWELGWKQRKKAKVTWVEGDGGRWEQVAGVKPPVGPARTRWMCGGTLLALWEDTSSCLQTRSSLGRLSTGGCVPRRAPKQGSGNIKGFVASLVIWKVEKKRLMWR